MIKLRYCVLALSTFSTLVVDCGNMQEHGLVCALAVVGLDNTVFNVVNSIVGSSRRLLK